MACDSLGSCCCIEDCNMYYLTEKEDRQGIFGLVATNVVSRDVETGLPLADGQASKDREESIIRACLKRWLANNSDSPLIILFICLLLVIGWTLFVPIIGISFYPLSAIEEGFDRDFQYRILPFYQLTTNLWWGSYIRFLFPAGFVTSKTLVLFTLVATALSMWLNVTFVKGMCFLDALSYSKLVGAKPSVFPLPFSLAFTEIFPMFLMVALPALWTIRKGGWTTRHTAAHKYVYVLFWASFFAFGWGFLMKELEKRHVLQIVVGFSAGLLKFFFKMVIGSSLTHKADPHKFITANYAVDIVFARVQAAVVPFFDNVWVFLASLLLGEILLFIWRFYIGPDRCTLWFQGLLCGRCCKHKGTVYQEHEEHGKWVCKPFGASTEEMCKVSLKAQEDKKYHEREWIDRAMYHYVDATGGLVISIIVRIHSIACIHVARTMAPGHVQSRFDIDGQEWSDALGFAWGAVGILCAFLGVTAYWYFPKIKDPVSNKPLQLEKVLRYIFIKGDNTFFFLGWLIVTGNFVIACMVEHFGFDLKLEWNYFWGILSDTLCGAL